VDVGETKKIMTTETCRCVVMFADVAGSTRLYEELGDQVAQRMIAERLASMAAVVERFQGTVIKTIGDEIMVRFDEPDLAIMAACHIHELDATKTVQGVILSEHIGLHYGSILISKGDLFGDAVNVAARLTSVARGGQIITSQETMDRLSDDLTLLARKFDVTKVKGRKQPVSMYEVIWESEDDVTGIHDQGITRPLALEPLLLRCHKEERTLLPNSVMLLGRGSQCDLVIKGNAISRLHAFIEYHNGKFVLRDESTNGTYVKMNGGRTVYLRREEWPLLGSGVISLGAPVREPDHRLLYFDAQQTEEEQVSEAEKLTVLTGFNAIKPND